MGIKEKKKKIYIFSSYNNKFHFSCGEYRYCKEGFKREEERKRKKKMKKKGDVLKYMAFL